MDEIYTDEIDSRLARPENRTLLALWSAKAAATGGLPVYADFNLNAIAPLGDLVAVLEPAGEGGWIYHYFGRELGRLAGFDLTGKLLSDLPGDVAGNVGESNRLAVTLRRPVLLLNHAALSKSIHVWERLVLPVAGPRGPVLLSQSVPLVLRQDLVESILQSGTSALIACLPILAAGGGLADLQVVISNRAAGTLFSGDDTASVQGTLRSIIADVDANGVMAACMRVLETGAPAQLEAQCRIGAADGFYEIGISRFENGVTLTFADLGALRRAYHALEQQRTELLLANQMLESQASSLAALAEQMELARHALDDEIAQRVLLEAELRRLASVDDLTGTMNRRAFLEMASREVSRAERYGNPVAIAAIDLDRFKLVNDGHGHAVGDEVLRQVAATLTRSVRVGIDEVGRLGGEEFIVLLPETSLEGALVAADRMREAIDELEIEIDGHTFGVTASFGVAVWQGGAETLELWMARADQALYRAKAKGRNRVELADATAPDADLGAHRAA